uniref:Uncharacterized protein n=1 Tax=Chenopodium quinoa TaxID=63459 RepID=A0A803LVB8_CHEQI
GPALLERKEDSGYFFYHRDDIVFFLTDTRQMVNMDFYDIILKLDSLKLKEISILDLKEVIKDVYCNIL